MQTDKRYAGCKSVAVHDQPKQAPNNTNTTTTTTNNNNNNNNNQIVF